LELLPNLPIQKCLYGLVKESGADAFQVKSVSEHRLVRKFGQITVEQVGEIAAAIALCVGY